MAKVCHQIGVAGDVGAIFRALHHPQDLEAWWATTADGSPEAGDVVNLHFTDLVTLSFRIEELAETAQVRLRCVAGPHPWQDCSLTFTLRPDADQVLGASLSTRTQTPTTTTFCTSIQNGRATC